MSLDARPLTRQDVIDACPHLQSSPTQVRDWLKRHLVYRGVDPAEASKFILRGFELHRMSHVTLVHAFKYHCGMLI
ncbi:hypothetical protein F4825DRAFT_423295 [Nemania diffusa]|nr:hypothetical protein F4825DRAFT_423295 [Nemania diffusa]